MRFCPFCAAENADEATHCAACARRLPALPARRTQTQSTTGNTGPLAPKQAAPRPADPETRPLPLELRPGPAAELKRVSAPPDGASAAPAPAPEATAAGPPPASEPVPPPAQAPPADRPEYSGPATVISPPPTPAATPREDELPSATVRPMPEVPEAGLFAYARYAIAVAQARWARRGAIKLLAVQIKEHVARLDGVLGNLGREARAAKLEQRAFADENRMIDTAERRRVDSERSCVELTNKKTEENQKFDAIHRDLSEKLQQREAEASNSGQALERLEVERRTARDRRKEIERQQRAYYKAADEREEQAQRSSMGDTRAQLRRAAEDLRSDAARLQPEREDLERRLHELEGPLREATGRHEQARSELEAARRALEDAREGHRHRLAELEAELAHRSRELSQAEAEIGRRLVTLGTLLNLHRVEGASFQPLYEKIDALRAAIALRERETDRLNAERFAYDRASLVRGLGVLGGIVVLVIAIICILIAVI